MIRGIVGVGAGFDFAIFDWGDERVPSVKDNNGQNWLAIRPTEHLDPGKAGEVEIPAVERSGTAWPTKRI